MNNTTMSSLMAVVVNDIYISFIKEYPTADVVEVRHGHWVKEKPDVLIHWHCSACKKCYYLEEPKSNYCPECGAKMRKTK